MKLGHIESTGNQFKTFYAVKEDVVDDSEVVSGRGGDGDLMGSERAAKAAISLDLDCLTQSEYGDLHEVMNDRSYPHKLYLREPAVASQRILMTGAGSNVAKQWKTDTAVPTEANYTSNATEFTVTDYTNIQNFTTDVSYDTNDKEYLHLFFKFNLATWIAAYGLDYLTRLTLLLQDPLVSRTVLSVVDNYGYSFYAYNFASTSWTEMKRQSITIDVSNQQYAALSPREGFTRWTDYLSSNLALFRMTNRQARDSSGTLAMSLNYIELFINGYGVKQINPYDLNWREPYTGAGYTGTLRLQEL